MIPRALREAIGLADGGRVEVIESDGQIVITPVPQLSAEAVREILESVRR